MVRASDPARRPLGADFNRLWVAMGSCNFGDGLRVAAIPLLGSLLTDSPALVAGLTSAVTAPWLLFALLSGVMVDRTDHRKLLIVVSLTRGLMVAAFAALVWLGFGTIALLYVVALVAGTGETLFDNAAQAMVPGVLAHKDSLERANGRLVSTEIAGNEAVGPALGSTLFAVSPVAPFGVSGALGLVAAMLAARIRRPDPGGRSPDAGEVPQTILASIREGIVWVWGNRPMRTATIAAVLLSLFDSAWFAILVLYATWTLAANEFAFG